MKYKLMTDSACDLPKDLIKKYDIDIISLKIQSGDDEYLDKIDIDSEEIFKRMKNKEIFKTSQITPMEFEKSFEKYAQNDISVLYLGFSSGLSSTYDSSVMAVATLTERYPNWNGITFDTKCVCGGLGLMVLKAAQMMESGCSKEQLFQMLEHYKNHMEHIFTVDDIEFLYKGGRVSKTAAVVGGILNIKPILYIVDGNISVLEKVRGSKKVNSKIVEILNDKADDLPNQVISMGYCSEQEKFEATRNEIKDKVGYKDLLYTYLGATISAHTGPGMVSVFFLNKKFDS